MFIFIFLYMNKNTHLRPHRMAIMTVKKRPHRSTHTKAAKHCLFFNLTRYPSMRSLSPFRFELILSSASPATPDPVESPLPLA